MTEVGSTTQPKIRPVELRSLAEQGVLMAANERFFWPLGLALTWTLHPDGSMDDLRVTEWDYGDGHVETIDLEPGDAAGVARRQAFAAWARRRLGAMEPDERSRALDRLSHRRT